MNTKWFAALTVICIGILTTSAVMADMGDLAYDKVQALAATNQNAGNTSGTILNPEGRGDLLIFPYYEAPGHVLGECPAEPRMRRELLIAVTDGDLTTEADLVDQCLQDNYRGMHRMELVPLKAEVTPIEFWLDLPGIPGSKSFAHVQGHVCLLIDGSTALIREGEHPALAPTVRLSHLRSCARLIANKRGVKRSAVLAEIGICSSYGLGPYPTSATIEQAMQRLEALRGA